MTEPDELVRIVVPRWGADLIYTALLMRARLLEDAQITLTAGAGPEIVQELANAVKPLTAMSDER